MKTSRHQHVARHKRRIARRLRPKTWTAEPRPLCGGTCLQDIELRRQDEVYLDFRGDTDFTQTRHLDRWDTEGARFVFGSDARANVIRCANALPVDTLLSNWAYMVMAALA